MSFHVKNLVVGALALSCMAFFGLPVNADTTAEAGRAIAAKWQDAVVTLQIVSKVKANMDGDVQSKEMKQEVTGAIIDPSGLIVTSGSGINITDLITQAMEGSGEDAPKITCDVTSVKVIMGDGRELDAKVVLRDKDLDLAFIRPVEKPDSPLPSLNLAQSTKPQAMDELISIDRLGTVAYRSLSLSTSRVVSIVEKPRTFYVVDGRQGLGTPVFALDGNLVGFSLIRAKPKGDASSFLELNSSSSGIPGVIGIVLPVTEISQAAKQAPETVAAAPAPAPVPVKATTPAPAKKSGKGSK